ncbi:ribose-5-phosphate isomerase RpiA [Sphingomonas montana]|uniref:ribose-5-phosphate isomerase RpiA n=1 Tax=Sphingomonas montana TaxID=1843236 RepID=UPI00096FC3DE|nr:ribose-5-phosphate isomerase RpiA [Sphingomonas montana]
MTADADKHAAALAATAEVRPGMLVGLGTGSTAAHAIMALGERVRAGLRITAVATSRATEMLAGAHGITVLPFDDVPGVDLTIDGVDQIDPCRRAIKGGGGAMLREKIVAAASTRMIAIADGSKRVGQLDRAIPVEILPFARAFVLRRLAELGASATLRIARSDQDNLLADAAFGPIADPAGLAVALSAIPGLLGHGLFLHEIDHACFALDGTVFWDDRP